MEPLAQEGLSAGYPLFLRSVYITVRSKLVVLDFLVHPPFQVSIDLSKLLKDLAYLYSVYCVWQPSPYCYTWRSVTWEVALKQICPTHVRSIEPGPYPAFEEEGKFPLSPGMPRGNACKLIQAPIDKALRFKERHPPHAPPSTCVLPIVCPNARSDPRPKSSTTTT
jgi:hypothetical protein